MELIFVACLLAAPEQCRESRIAMLELPGPVACLVVAQQMLASWEAAHPQWGVAHWRCAPIGYREREVERVLRGAA